MDSIITLDAIVVAAADQVSCPLGDEAAILNMKNSVYYGLDPVGAHVWALLREPKRVFEIRDALMAEYDVEGKRCEDDLLALLERLRSEGLVEVREPAT